MTLAPESLRGRFLLAILLWVGLGTGAIWWSSVRLFTAHVEDQYHEELQVHVRELAGLTRLGPDGNPQLSRPLSDPRYGVPLSGFYWQVTRPGAPALRSASMTRGALDDSVANSPSIRHQIALGPTGPAVSYGFLQKPQNGTAIHFVIATDKRLMQEIINRFTQELSLWLVLLATALVLSGIAIITFGLRPFGRLRTAIANLQNGTTQRLAGDFPDELKPIVTDLNAYAERNAEIVDRGRIQAGNLAHSLRTPLAVMTDEAEKMLEAGFGQQQATIFLTESEKMQHQIDYHLARNRSGGSLSGLGTTARFDQILPPLLSAMRRLHPTKVFLVEGPLTSGLVFPCDPDDLSEIMVNLLDNAGKWATKQVRVAWTNTEQGHRISVTDDGPGLSPDEIERAFVIGTRFDAEKSGSGLGLAISRDIVRDYGGELALAVGPGGGIQAVVHFCR